jgi:hypothetical protein
MFDLDGRQVQIKELTLGEIREWVALAASQSDGFDVVDALLFDDFEMPALLRMTDLSPSELSDCTPTDLRRIVAVCREVNADFFAMRERMAREMRSLFSQTSSAPG